MAEDAGAKGAPNTYSEAELDWVQDHLGELRQSISGQRLLLQSLGIGFAIGLAAYVAGYALKANVTTEPWKLLADFLYALGWALWTGVVVALFVEIIPRAKQRQIKHALDAYEAALRAKAKFGGGQSSKSDA